MDVAKRPPPSPSSYMRAGFRRHPFRLAMADATRPQVSCLQALTGAIALARALRAHWRRDELRVGILLPPSVGGALVTWPQRCPAERA